MGRKKKKNKEDLLLIKGFLKYYKPYKLHCAGLFFLIIFNLCISLVQPILWSRLITTLFSRNIYGLKQTIFLITSLYLVSTMGSFLQSALTSYLNAKLTFHMQNHIFNNLLSMNMHYFDSSTNGTFISKIILDISQIIDLVMNQIIPAVVNIIKVVLLLVIMFQINMMLTLFTVCLLPFVLYIYGKKSSTMRKKQADVRSSNDAVIGIIQQAVQGIKDIKALGLKHIQNEIFMKGNSDKTKKVFGYSIFILSFHTFLSIMGVIGELSIFAIGSYFVISSIITVEKFIQFTSYSQQFSSSSLSLVTIISDYQKIIVSLTRLHEIEVNISQSHEEFGNIETVTENLGIQMNQIHYQYDQNQIFCGADMYIQPNKMTAITGQSGCGKTTAFNLIMGLYKTVSGEILINGIHIGQLSEKALRRQIAVVSQKPFLFNSSIKENFQYVNSSIKEEEIIAICKKCGIHEAIEALSSKYDTVISENGSNFSTGQLQRLSIARALAKNTPILLLDEPTSALDDKNAVHIKDLLRSLRTYKTILIISHNKDLINASDCIYEIRQNKIVQV